MFHCHAFKNEDKSKPIAPITLNIFLSNTASSIPSSSKDNSLVFLGQDLIHQWDMQH